MSALGDPGGDDLVGDLIAEVARTHGIAISRDDPVIAVVLLNQLVLRRYLEEAVAPVTATIREATREAAAEIEQLAQAQAAWLEQVSLKDRATFLEEQQFLHQAWKANMDAIIEGQNGALQRVVMQAITLLRNDARTTGSDLTKPSAPLPAQTLALTGRGNPWAWIWAGMLLGAGVAGALGLATAIGRPFAGP